MKGAQARGAGGSRIIWTSVISNGYRPLRGLDSHLVLQPGAHAPGFMLASAPRTETRFVAARLRDAWQLPPHLQILLTRWHRR